MSQWGRACRPAGCFEHTAPRSTGSKGSEAHDATLLDLLNLRTPGPRFRRVCKQLCLIAHLVPLASMRITPGRNHATLGHRLPRPASQRRCGVHHPPAPESVDAGFAAGDLKATAEPRLPRLLHPGRPPACVRSKPHRVAQHTECGHLWYWEFH